MFKKQAAANYLRRKVDDDNDDFTEQMDNKLCENIFRSAFDTLDTSAKSILRLYWEEMSPQEIADKLGFTYGYVRKKKCEAQSELIMKVKKHPDYRKIVNHENIKDSGTLSSSGILHSR
jgi:DNA-directed RNA polymerase specialized sigma24 family protein